MAVRRLAETQPETFAFTESNLEWAKAQILKFPEGRQASAVIPLLWRAQEQHDGWLPEPAIRHVGELLDMPYIRVLEIATFYTMFNLEPVGKHFVQLCGTTPCRLRGADDLIEVCERVIGKQRVVTEDGQLSWLEVECLGACVNAPMAQINKDYYEDLTAENFEQLLSDLRDGKDVQAGPQNGRQLSAPLGGPTTLLGDPPYSDGTVSETKSGPEDAAVSVEEPATADPEPEPEDEPVSAAASVDISQDEDKPDGLPAPVGVADDLKRISGIGPKIEGTLNKLGVYHYAQIAKWTDANKAWVDAYLSFKGRIDREKWVQQAAELAEGGETKFSARVDKGDVPSSKG